MKKISFAFICAVALLSFTGCKKKGGSGEAIAKMTEFSDKMCKCADKACADKVQEEMNKWSADQAKNASGDKAAKMSDEDTKKMTEATEKYGKCMMKAMGGGDTPPAGGDMGSGAAPPAGSGEPPAAGSGAAPAAGSGEPPAAGSGAAPAAGSGEEKK